MALPDVAVVITDGALGIVPANTDNIAAKVGVCSLGSANTIYPFTDKKTLVDTLGTGPLVDACAHLLEVAGGPVYAVPVLASVAGTNTAVTKTGSGGTVTIAGAPRDSYEAILAVVAAGILGAGSFKYSLDGGDSYSPEITIPAGGTYLIPGSNITVTFGAGTYAADTTYTWTSTAPGYSTTDLSAAITALLNDNSKEWFQVHAVGAPSPSSSAVTQSGSMGPPAMTLTGTPVAFIDAIVEITTGGVVGTAAFKYSLDNGATYVTGVATASTVALGSTGLTLNFAAGTYVLADLYKFTTYTSIAAFFAALDTLMAAAATVFRFTSALMEAPASCSDTILAKAMASSASTRVMVAAGSEELVLSVSGRVHRRSAAWPIAARAAKAPIHEDLARVASGPLPGIVSLARDEAVTPALDAARFATLRTMIGRQGFYVTNPKVMAAAGSDFSLLQYRRVMDKACAVARNALLTFLNDSVRVDATTGFILEKDAKAIEAFVEGQLNAALVAPGSASAVQVLVKRDANILSTQTMPTTVRIVPLGYAKTITEEIGFSNPALQLRAA